jgi:hypothetical protein
MRVRCVRKAHRRHLCHHEIVEFPFVMMANWTAFPYQGLRIRSFDY